MAAERTTPATDARALAQARLLGHLAEVSQMAREGHIPAARMALDDAMSDLDDIAGLITEQEKEEHQ